MPCFHIVLNEFLKLHPYLDLEYTQPTSTIDYVFHNKQPNKMQLVFKPSQHTFDTHFHY
jgi:hypothetical protein